MTAAPSNSLTHVRLGERHEKIIADLEAIFLEEGFRKRTINDLSMRLKCSKRTLYEIAPSKQELALLVMERWLERIRHLREILDDGIRRGRFRGFHSQLVAEVFLAAVGRINEMAVLQAPQISLSEAFAELFQLILHGIVEHPAP
jgi:AcrR family transcriptional regulator